MGLFGGKKKKEEQQTQNDELKEQFQLVDRDKDGMITRQEFATLCRNMALYVSPGEKNILFASYKVSLEDLTNFLAKIDQQPKPETQATPKQPPKQAPPKQVPATQATQATRTSQATSSGSQTATAAAGARNSSSQEAPRRPLPKVQKSRSVFDRVVRPKSSDPFEKLTTIYKPKKGVGQDMTAPLSHYFISAGHNSYLTGNQLSSKSSVKPIIDALEGGCRVIELDVWTGRREPRVLHGNTMTKPVSFLKCIKAIKQHAFVKSNFPVIITIENHCNTKNKQQMARILNEELGALIYRDANSKNWTKYPSPRDLRQKILIRDKDKDVDDVEQAQPASSAPTTAPGTVAAQARESATAPKGVQRVSTVNAKRPGSQQQQQPLTKQSSFAQRRNETKWDKLRQQEQEGQQGDPSELKELITIKNMKFHQANESATVASSSRGEGTFDGLVAKRSTTLKHTQKHLLRTYPGGRRVDSSNYEPWVPWSFGAQIVALNWQTPGIPMYVYRGFFRNNGECGYVKKPKWMLQENPPQPEDLPFSRTLEVRVIGAKNLGLKRARNCVVAVDVFGLELDMGSDRTKSVPTTDTCTFEEKFQFKLRCPEISVLLLSLCLEDHRRLELVGQYAMPVDNILVGKFQVPLLSRDNKQLKTAIFVELSNSAVATSKANAPTTSTAVRKSVNTTTAVAKPNRASTSTVATTASTATSATNDPKKPLKLFADKTKSIATDDDTESVGGSRRPSQALPLPTPKGSNKGPKSEGGTPSTSPSVPRHSRKLSNAP